MSGRTFNIYCDESGHLPNDRQPVMVLGAVMCPTDKSREISVRLREIKERHHLPRPFEVKWTNVSPAKYEYYQDLVDYFFDDDDLKFRAVVAPKAKLDHARFDQSHDDWYYKMMYQLLTRLLTPQNAYRVYLDKKDTHGGEKARKLHDVLANSMYDFDHRIVERVQIVESHAVAQLQLADLLLGAVSYTNRELTTSDAKASIAKRVQQRSGYHLTRSTLLREEKFNLFHWTPQASWSTSA